MSPINLPPIPLFGLVLSVAFLYASVGFGGASGYLAAMSLFDVPPNVMASTALILNILVSSISFLAYFHANHFAPRLLWPFLLGSIPTAFLGGYIRLDEGIYLSLLYLVLTYVAGRLLLSRTERKNDVESLHNFPFWLALLAGAVIGLLSGMVGIGGGIFLSPLIILSHWGSPKQASAASAAFIALNSVSGLLGRWIGGNLEIGWFGLSLLPLGAIGALGGATLGARYLSGSGLRRLLGVVLLLAVLRYWLNL